MNPSLAVAFGADAGAGLEAALDPVAGALPSLLL